MGDKVIVLPVALGLRTALTTFNFSSTDVGSAEHALGNSTDMYGERFLPVAKQTVIAASLDWFVQSYNLRYPTHIKLDVDGIEQEVLEGMEMLLALNTVVGILVEVREGSKEEISIMAMLRKHGFYYEQKGYATSSGFANLIFSRQKLLA
jgi:FkbM family methyltransferase